MTFTLKVHRGALTFLITILQISLWERCKLAHDYYEQVNEYHRIPKIVASLVSSVGRMVAPLTGRYWVRIPVGLALHPHISSSS